MTVLFDLLIDRPLALLRENKINDKVLNYEQAQSKVYNILLQNDLLLNDST